nr:carotenoid 9,10(9',10')-cleavage dioxygenase 1-like [Solanum lycopersicum]
MDVPKVILKEVIFKLLDNFIDLTFEFVDQPLSPSQSNFAPVEEIGEAVRVTTIQGKIPNDFPEGVYIRNGSNALFGGLKSTKSIFGKSSHIWVEGEGMLHALYFTKEKGKINKWNILYKNKYVETDTFNMEKNLKKPKFIPNIEGDSLAVLVASLLNVMRFGVLHKYLSNTNVFEHSKKLYSIAENHMPQEINIQTLETLGNWTVNGAWSQSFTAHPKKIPDTGELVIMGINPLKPYLELGIISADGKQMVHKVDVKLNRCIICHEIGVTKRYNVILDFPLTIDLNRLIIGEQLIKYDKDGHARIGIMPHYGDANSIKWFEIEPCCVFHIINCFEDNDEVVVRACRARKSIIPRPDIIVDELGLSLDALNEMSFSKDNIKTSEDLFSFSKVCEWRLNMKTGEVKMKNVTTNDHRFIMEFPMINEHFIGLKNKFGYLQLIDSEAFSNYFGGFAKFGGLAKLNFEEISKDFKEEEDLIKVEYHIFPKNTFCSGATFVPKLDGVDEDDGWIVAFTHNENTNQSQVYIIDAKKFESEAVAIIILPSRVPYGFHGAFMSSN